VAKRGLVEKLYGKKTSLKWINTGRLKACDLELIDEIAAR
jgi:hypothetical protein